MPYIIILTGHPCSGKSTLANTIRDRVLLTQQHLIDKVVIVDELLANSTLVVATDNSESIAQLCYTSSATEKVLRAGLKSAFDRAVAAAVHDEKLSTQTLQQQQQQQNNDKKKKKTLIILDSTNYIKGYRYELYCICKAATSSYCVVWCLNDVYSVKEWNMQRRMISSDPTNSYYSDELLDALILRYEPPDERNRWDQPLYRIDLRPSGNFHHQHLQEQQQQGTGTGLAEQLLHQSLYNMHNLSEAISSTTTTTDATERDTISDPQGHTNEQDDVAEISHIPKVKTSSTFKRSAFQKKTTTASTTTTTTKMRSSAASTKPMALTADALSSFSNELSSLQSTTIAGTVSSQGMTSRKQNSVPPSNKNVRQQPSQQQRSVQRHPTTVEEQVDEFLLQFIRNVKPLKEGTSTRQHQSVESDVLHIVDTITQQLCNTIIDVVTSATTIDNTTDRMAIPLRDNVWYLDCSKLSMDQRDQLFTTDSLRQIRTDYVQWIRKNPMEELQQGDSTKVIIESFLSYITTQIQQR